MSGHVNTVFSYCKWLRNAHAYAPLQPFMYRAADRLLTMWMGPAYEESRFFQRLSLTTWHQYFNHNAALDIQLAERMEDLQELLREVDSPTMERYRTALLRRKVIRL